MTRLRVEPRSRDQGRRKNDAFTLSATLPTYLLMLVGGVFALIGAFHHLSICL